MANMEVCGKLLLCGILHSILGCGVLGKTIHKSKNVVGFEINEIHSNGAARHYRYLNSKGKESPNVVSELDFHQSNYIGMIYENEPTGSKVNVVGQLSVKECVDVHYSILNHKDLFSLDHFNFINTHNVIIRSLDRLDREVKEVYTVSIEAVCLNGVQSQTDIVIHVLDRNDVEPKFLSSVVSVTSHCDQSFHKKITTISAYDEDQNEKISYFAQESCTKDFYLEPDTGDLYSKSDFLYPGSYKIIVYAVDSVGHTSQPLTIHIKVQNPALTHDTMTYQSHTAHHVEKRATTTVKKEYEKVENNTFSNFLFTVASVQPRPFGENYKLVNTSVPDMFEGPDSEGNVYIVQGKRLDYENVNHRIINMVFLITNTNTPNGRYHLNKYK